jgi:hypothetical protein
MLPSSQQSSPSIAVRMCSYGHVTLAVGAVTLHLTEDEFLAVAAAVMRAADLVTARTASMPATPHSH